MNEQPLEQLLNRYFNKKIQLRKERKSKALSTWQPVVDKILEEVKRVDKRYDLTPFMGGSYYERTKTKEPDEFDIMLEILSLTLGEWETYDGREDGLSSEPPEGNSLGPTYLKML